MSKMVVEVADRTSGAKIRVTVEVVEGPVVEATTMFEDVVYDVFGPDGTGMDFWWRTVEAIDWWTDGVKIEDDERKPE